MIKINLACGDVILPGYINCDLYNTKADVKCDVTDLSRFEDNSVDEILAQHIIEHFSYPEVDRILLEWKRVLKPGGELIIETPDFYESCKKFVSLPEEQRYTMYGHFFAKSWIDGETHKFLFTKGELWNVLTRAGFKNIDREAPTRYLKQPNLRLICYK